MLLTIMQHIKVSSIMQAFRVWDCSYVFVHKYFERKVLYIYRHTYVYHRQTIKWKRMNLL